MTLTAAVDGSALGNPGPAGWAWFVDDSRWAAGGWPNGTNNRGELQAVIELLAATADVDDLHVLCDSKYVINSITKWMPKWKLQGWKKANKEDVLNRDQMERLDELMTAREAAGLRVRFEWVKGHAGHPLNEAADTRARGAAEAMQAGLPVPSGPGMGEPGVVLATPTSDAPCDSPPATVVVSCPLESDLADAIVAEAGRTGRTAQDLLAELIQTGWEARA
ncbi:ribonuclease H family protein [Brevibacterium yomogidense]|uniref:ribonuclease H family protein n=1 Tax=Brevibacterium yomogidense TaxID=946573 RepID=UPI0018DF97B6